MNDKNLGEVKRKGTLSFVFIVLMFFSFIPLHEFFHAYSCWNQGGKVVGIDYWSHTTCGGNIESKVKIQSIGSFGETNDLYTGMIFYPLLFIFLAQGLWSLFRVSRHHPEKGGGKYRFEGV